MNAQRMRTPGVTNARGAVGPVPAWFLHTEFRPRGNPPRGAWVAHDCRTVRMADQGSQERRRREGPLRAPVR